MELSMSVPERGGFLRRAAPICCGAALVAGTGFLATHDPGAAGARYPGCLFHQTTGLWCPGCGLTRGTYQLLHGHVGAALGYNLFTPLALVAIAVAWFAWVRTSWNMPAPRLPRHTATFTSTVLPTLLIAYGVLRNIPVGPLRSLAP
ncbi:MAG TPA: DUF2752 domain-containing protein [Ilumatobacteraceae bacterium]|jgi:hypothetical protein|nr:DUF2752 domain-containing protein [Ilumatobacteraceae bacterium]